VFRAVLAACSRHIVLFCRIVRRILTFWRRGEKVSVPALCENRVTRLCTVVIGTAFATGALLHLQRAPYALQFIKSNTYKLDSVFGRQGPEVQILSPRPSSKRKRPSHLLGPFSFWAWEGSGTEKEVQRFAQRITAIEHSEIGPEDLTAKLATKSSHPDQS
jgi:hypothetical protein